MKQSSIFRSLFVMCGMLFVSVFLVAGIASCLELESSAFDNEGNIPLPCTGRGDNLSPVLSWSDVPEGTKSFALVVDDPDAPGGEWVHWVIYDIPGGGRSLNAAVPPTEIAPDGSKQGVNSFRRLGYGGPDPPPGPPHRYIFTLYAVDVMLNISPGATNGQLQEAMRGRVLEKATLVGMFGR